VYHICANALFRPFVSCLKFRVMVVSEFVAEGYYALGDACHGAGDGVAEVRVKGEGS
jgi:hypothetical protein